MYRHIAKITRLLTGGGKKRVRYPEWFWMLARTGLWLRRGDYWHFHCIHVETATPCNRRCPHCPVSVSPLPKMSMGEDVLNMVAIRLAAIQWNGPVTLCRFNEPLLDPRLVRCLSMLRATAPQAAYQIFTNGDLLTLDKAHELVAAGLQAGKISCYDKPPKPQWKRNIDAVVAAYPDVFTVLDPITDPYVIGGLNKDLSTPKLWCDAPSWSFIINVNGDVTLCCLDYYRDHIYGNIIEQDIMSIWRNPEFAKVRRELRKGTARHGICRDCFGLDRGGDLGERGSAAVGGIPRLPDRQGADT